jgi:hypothetical protein
MRIERIDSPAIAVVGHLVRDEIVSSDGVVKIALGGTAYNLRTLAAIMDKGKILPVCRIGRDITGPASELFASSDLFDNTGVQYARRPNVIHRLIYSADGSRREWNSGRQSPLDFETICKKADAVLLNFISGNDVRLKDLKSFKSNYRGLVYGDYHSLSLGFGSDQIRYYRHHPRWREYLACIDMIQMNVAELATICQHKLDDIQTIKDACLNLHTGGPKVIIITMGSKGVMVSEQKDQRFWRIPAMEIPEEIDPTGCGDTLSATFVFNYLRSGDLVRSVEIANRCAGAKATFSGLDGYAKMRQIIDAIGPRKRAARC